MLNTLIAVYREGRNEAKRNHMIFRLFAALRILLFPVRTFQFCSMNLARKLHHPNQRHDPLYFFVHNYYLSKKLTLRQRATCAIRHHQYELERYNAEYANRVYASTGIVLWSRYVDNRKFTIVLVATDDNRHEGDLSVILAVDDVRLCRMSFGYLDADVFGLSPHPTMLISRNQTDLNDGRACFSQCFKQNTPQFFCLAAVCGIAMANGFETMLAIKHDAQIAYEKDFDSGFQNSYTLLWEKFEAVEIDDHVYQLPVPLSLRPLPSVSRSHRGRARGRRMYWNDIMESARLGVANYRRASVQVNEGGMNHVPLAKVFERLRWKAKGESLLKY